MTFFHEAYSLIMMLPQEDISPLPQEEVSLGTQISIISIIIFLHIFGAFQCS